MSPLINRPDVSDADPKWQALGSELETLGVALAALRESIPTEENAREWHGAVTTLGRSLRETKNITSACRAALREQKRQLTADRRQLRVKVRMAEVQAEIVTRYRDFFGR